MFISKSSINKLANIQKRTLRFVCDDCVSNYSELSENAALKGWNIMTLCCTPIKVFKCVNNMNPQYSNEMFTQKKCTYDLRDNSFLERSTERLTNYDLKSFKISKIWNLLPAPYKWRVSFDTFKTWSEHGLYQPTNVESAVCLQLDCPIISVYNNLTNHNCLLC